jgi:LPXTG-motif cell wall-anchored protein
MKKIIFWIGIIILILGIISFFLSSSKIIPFFYGTNQMIWSAITGVGLIVLIIGLALKKKK